MDFTGENHGMRRGGCSPKKPTVEFQSPISPKIKFNLKNDPGLIFSRESNKFVSNLILRL